MDLFDDDSDDIEPVSESPDKGLVISPKDKERKEENKRTDLVKEVIANDVKEMGVRAAAALHGVSKSSAGNWSNGIGVSNQDAKTRILDAKNEIENLAVTKLMMTLDMLNPLAIEKEKDKVTVINGLSQVIERISEGSKGKEGTKVLHLHLYDPGRNSEKDYEVIDA